VNREDIVTQRQLTGKHVVLEDARWYAKYVFPFFNVQWRVPFVVFDVIGGQSRLWDKAVTFDGRQLRIDAPASQVAPTTSVDPKRFEGLLHFDPWWAFKGAGLPADLVRAVVPTNVAGRQHPLDVPRTVVDVAFDREFEFLVAVETEDEHFARKTFVEGTLDLAKLRS
jgi:hypothetical protein